MGIGVDRLGFGYNCERMRCILVIRCLCKSDLAFLDICWWYRGYSGSRGLRESTGWLYQLNHNLSHLFFLIPEHSPKHTSRFIAHALILAPTDSNPPCSLHPTFPSRLS